MRFLAALLLLVSTAAAAPPRIIIPNDNTPTVGKIAIGHKLFFDPRLSRNGTVSCSTCHDPARAYTDGRQIAVGFGRRLGTRNAPTILNAAALPLVFWDGRAALLEGQSLLPLANPREMANDSVQDVVNRLNQIPGYVQLFREEFGTNVTAGNMAVSISSFQRTLLSYEAPADQFVEGDQLALSPAAQLGFRVFREANCIDCHDPRADWRDGGFHNTGVARFLNEPEQGRFTITQNINDLRAFKTPTLREIVSTAPYMHSGRFPTIDSVVDYYNNGGSNDPRQDRRIRRLGLTVQTRAALIRFLVEGFASPNTPYVSAPALPR